MKSRNKEEIDLYLRQQNIIFSPFGWIVQNGNHMCTTLPTHDALLDRLTRRQGALQGESRRVKSGNGASLEFSLSGRET